MSEARPAPVEASVLDLLARQAAARGDAPALAAPDAEPRSYAVLHARVLALAHGLRRAGVSPATRVAIVLPNGADLALALLGAASAGVAVPLNPAYRAEELRAYLRELRPAFLLVDADGTRAAGAVAVARELGAAVLRLGAGGTLEGDGISLAESAAPVAPQPHDLALILLTSGSTGRAKKVPLSHRNLCTSARDVSASVALGPDDRCLCLWEQFHIGGVVDLLLAPLASGGSVVCAGGFDAERALALLATSGATWFQGVPTTLRELLLRSRAAPASARRHRLRFLRSVAAALPPELEAELERTFGVPVIQTFGMTEASPLITSTALPPAPRKPGSVGRACGPEVAILDAAGERLPPGAHGEVAVRGDNVFAGYEDDDEADARAFRDGWFLTGDTGTLDADGHLFLLGRTKELINRGGEKVSPFEVEAALAEHPAVAEAAAFALPHPTLGEEVGAAIVLAPGRTLDAGAVRAFVAARLAPFKVPRRIFFVPALPRGALGKLRRAEVAELALAAAPETARVAPEGPLEELLARLWAAELEREAVGALDEFAALGGDSLASVRLLAAVESLLGASIPDEAVPELTTVRAMARYLEAAGVRAPARAFDGDAIGAALARSTAGASASGEIDALVRRVAECRSLRELERVWESLLNELAPAELLALVDRAPAPSGALRLLADRAARERQSYWNARTRNVRAELRGGADALAWRRRPLADDACLYESERGARPGKRLVVGFTGLWYRLMMPAYRALAHLDAQRCDLLLLRDPTRSHYARGVAGLAGDLPALARFVEGFARRGGYADVATFGTSAGALPAVGVALASGFARALAVAPESLAEHPAVARVLDELAPERRNAGTEVVVVHAELHEVDAARADELERRLGRVQRVRVAGSDRHNALSVLHERSALRELLAHHLEARP